MQRAVRTWIWLGAMCILLNHNMAGLSGATVVGVSECVQLGDSYREP